MNKTEDELAQRTPGGRLVELDSLRGIAAFVVLFGHLRFAFHAEPARWFIRPFVAGHSAVTLFFALSGYVLSIPQWKTVRLPYGAYITRRFFRIYIPYAAAVCFALLVGWHLLDSKLPLSPWFYGTWHTAFSAHLIAVQFLTMPINPAINMAFWSLRYEVIMSIVFPMVCICLKRMGAGLSIVVGVVLMLGGNYLIDNENWYGRMSEVGRILLWSSPFIFGAVLSLKRVEVQTLYERHVYVRVALLAVAVVGFFTFFDPFVIPCAAVLVVYAQQGRMKRLLLTSIPEFLGEISYSIYLVHGTVLFAALILLYGKLPMWLTAGIYVVSSIALARLFFETIEKPAMEAGKRLTRP